MNENKYQSQLIKKIKFLFPGCHVLKNDSNYIQGVPDLTILYNDRWATLEVKMSKDSIEQPNQRYYINEFSEMSFAAFIFPENEEEVLHELQLAFGVSR